MSDPIATPIASSGARQKARPQTTSAQISPPNDSASLRPNYITADRLYSLMQAMTEHDWTVLGFVSGVSLATGIQLVRRFWDASRERNPSRARAGRSALKRLADWRVLDPLPIRAVGGLHGGSDTLIYAVGVAGVKLLARRGLTQKRLGTPGERYVKHTLAVTELVVRLYEADRRGELDLIGVEGEPACWRTFLGAGGARLVLKPDLFARIGVGALEDRWLVEVDLATEASGTLQAKMKRYLAYYRSGSEQHAHGVFPRVVWAVPDARRADQLADVLERLPVEARRLFSVCLLDETVGFLAAEAGS